MFCPKCASQNLDGASFCRSCGANISLVPQALTGQLASAAPEEIATEGRRRRRHNKEVTLDRSFKNIFMGVAFLLVAMALSRSGQGWWIWMLLPAFSMMGTGVAQYIRLKEREKQTFLAQPPTTNAFPNHSTPSSLAPPRRDELRSPAPSVTEGTTRHLGVEAPTRHLDANDPK